MVRVTCLSPTKSYSYCSSAFAHLENLISKLRTAILLLEAIIQSKQKVHLGTIHQNKRKTVKSILKDKARCYGYESARNTENRAKTKKLWLKQCTRDLFVRVLNF